MGKTGTVYSFVSPNNTNRYHGYAIVPGERKRVFLPGGALMAVDPETGALRQFRNGEEKKYPTPGVPVVLEYQNGTKDLQASKWGIAQTKVS
jgi:hypothetical protein